MPRLHTLMFGWEYPPIHLGGLGVACQGLVRGLMKNGVKVTLVLPHPDADREGDLDILFPTEEMLEHMHIASMLSPYDSAQQYYQRVKNVPRERQQIYGEDLGQAIANYSAASVEMTKDIRPDIVHCHDWMTYEAGVRAARYHRKPLVAHIHATELDRTHFSPNQWIYERERWGFEQADKIIAVSNYTKQILVSHYGIPAEKITVVHNGNNITKDINPEVIHSEYRKNHPPMVLFLGRLTLQKGPHQFLEMASAVHGIRPDVEFVVAGDGGMLRELIEHSLQLGLQNNIMFAGKVSNDEAQKLFAQADCFVMPSLSEPFGLVALEAIAQGTPVIISKQSGVSEVIGHAFKVDFWDTAKMADCVLTLLREDPLAWQLRSEASRVLDRLTWEHQAMAVRSLYQQILHS